MGLSGCSSIGAALLNTIAATATAAYLASYAGGGRLRRSHPDPSHLPPGHRPKASGRAPDSASMYTDER
jgi:hypothetical protein